MLKSLMSLMFAMAFAACNEDADRAEKLTKLRALGVSSSPAMVIPSTAELPQPVQLTFFAAVPAGQNIVAETFVDQPSLRSFPLTELQLDDSSAQYDEFARVRIYRITGSFVAPTAETLAQGVNRVLRLRYSVQLSAGAEVEKIVGDVLMVAADAEQAQWRAPTLSLNQPGDEELKATGDNAVEVAVTDSNAENVKVGWFVSAGKIENRRARATKWQDPGAGDQLLVVTARGVKSRTFSMVYKPFTVN